METLSTLALIISAAAMITLAVLTYLSVRIMREDSRLRNRPFFNVSGELRLVKAEENLQLWCTIINTGVLPGRVLNIWARLNDKCPIQEEEANEVMVIFPDEQVNSINLFNQGKAVSQDKRFQVNLIIEYCIANVKKEDEGYRYEVTYTFPTDEKDTEFSIRQEEISTIKCDTT